MKHLAVWRTYKESLGFTIKNFGCALKIGFIPIFGMLLASLLMGNSEFFYVRLARIPFLAFFGSLFDPRWMQYYNNPHLSLKWFQFDKVQFRYFKYALIFSLYYQLIFELLNLFFFKATPLTIFFYVLTTTSFSFITPAIALSQKTGFTIAFQQMTFSIYRKIIGLLLWYVGSFFIGMIFTAFLMGMLYGLLGENTFIQYIMIQPFFLPLAYFSVASVIYFTYPAFVASLTKFYQHYVLEKKSS